MLFVLIVSIGVASGGHFNPAVTAAFIVLRRIDPIDGLVYILAQLSGGVLGALLTKAFLLDEGRASRLRHAEDQSAARRRRPGLPDRGHRRLPPGAHGARRRAQPRGPPAGPRSRSAARWASWSWSSAR